MVQIEHAIEMVIGMGNCQIRFSETFNVFRLLKGYTTMWEDSNILKLYSEVVSFSKHANRRKAKTIALKR